jgi:hypothetical protein
MGQFYATTEHVVGVIGESRWPKQVDETRRALYGMLTEFLGGSHAENLEKRLRSHLNGRIARWEGEANERTSSLPPAEAKAVVRPSAANTVEIALPEPGGDTAPKAVETASAQPKPAASSSATGQGRNRGPKRDYVTAVRVAKVVAHIAPGGDWRASLDDILMALDDAKIPTPKTWGPKQGYRDWYAAVAADQAGRGRHLAIEAIKHHLKLAKEKPTETIP